MKEHLKHRSIELINFLKDKELSIQEIREKFDVSMYKLKRIEQGLDSKITEAKIESYLKLFGFNSCELLTYMVYKYIQPKKVEVT